jgi:hypothetical protein
MHACSQQPAPLARRTAAQQQQPQCQQGGSKDANEYSSCIHSVQLRRACTQALGTTAACILPSYPESSSAPLAVATGPCGRTQEGTDCCAANPNSCALNNDAHAPAYLECASAVGDAVWLVATLAALVARGSRRRRAVLLRHARRHSERLALSHLATALFHSKRNELLGSRASCAPLATAAAQSKGSIHWPSWRGTQRHGAVQIGIRHSASMHTC